MFDNNKLIKLLNNDINKLQNKIEYRNLYNIHNFVVRGLLKSGIAIDYALPFILAGIIVANSQASKGNAPFHIDEITEKASVETIDTSSGIHLEHISYDFSYDNELLEYSTGWIINDKGLYERTVTSYRLSDEINLEDTEKIISMTKEEIEKILNITNIETIKKKNLTPEDNIYSSDAIIVVNHFESEEKTSTRLETTGECVLSSISYIILTLCCGNSIRAIRNLERLFVKTSTRDKLRKYETLFRKIDKEELENMKKVLKLKQENLRMLDNESKNIGEKEGYPYTLRKNIKR